MTPYNNPAFLVIPDDYGAGIPVELENRRKEPVIIDRDRRSGVAGATAASSNKNLFSTVARLPGELMYAIQVDQDINCRTVRRCTYGAPLDREVLDLVSRQEQDGEESQGSPPIPLSQDFGRQFLYARYNADLGRRRLASGSRASIRRASPRWMRLGTFQSCWRWAARPGDSWTARTLGVSYSKDFLGNSARRGFGLTESPNPISRS